MSDIRCFRLGLVINPLAGIGGPAGLKGSDAPNTQALAQARGVSSKVAERVAEVFSLLAATLGPACADIEVLMPSGQMGLLLAEPWRCREIYQSPAQTSALDTQNAAKALLAQQPDLILFAGGDGTARDVFSALGSGQAVLGIPAGVKMHSGVFAISPRAAASVVASMIQGRLVAATTGEVRDIDEAAFAQGKVHTQYFGEMLVPDDQLLVQKVKCSGLPDDELLLDELAAYIDELIQEQDECLWILGSGGTLKHVKAHIGMAEPTLLGVDLWYRGECVQADAYEAQIWHWLEQVPSARLVLSVIGGQGVVLGRGNQQLSPRIIERVGLQHLMLASTPEKLRALNGAALQVDSGSAELDQALAGHRKVICGYEDTVLYPVA